MKVSFFYRQAGIFGCHFHRDCDCRNHRADHASGGSISADHASGGKDQCVLSGCECTYRVAGGGYSD